MQFLSLLPISSKNSFQVFDVNFSIVFYWLQIFQVKILSQVLDVNFLLRKAATVSTPQMDVRIFDRIHRYVGADQCIIFKTCIILILPSILLPGDRRGGHLDHQDVHHLEDHGAQVQGEEYLSETTPHIDVWQRQRHRRPPPWRPWSSSSRWRRKTYTWLLSAQLDYVCVDHWSGSLAII